MAKHKHHFGFAWAMILVVSAITALMLAPNQTKQPLHAVVVPKAESRSNSPVSQRPRFVPVSFQNAEDMLFILHALYDDTIAPSDAAAELAEEPAISLVADPVANQIRVMGNRSLMCEVEAIIYELDQRAAAVPIGGGRRRLQVRPNKLAVNDPKSAAMQRRAAFFDAIRRAGSERAKQ